MPRARAHYRHCGFRLPIHRTGAMTKTELQILKNQIALMYALMAIGRMLGFSEREKVDKIVQPSIDGTIDLIRVETER
jgi:hypothetical protein